MPERIRLQRTKGWRKPEGAVVVARPTKWGNPWRVRQPHPFGSLSNLTAQEAVDLYRWGAEMCAGGPDFDLTELRGKDLACWCPLDQPCHADVLLEMANAHPSCEAPHA